MTSRNASFGFVLSHLLLVSVLWASGFVFVKALIPVQGPFAISAWRASVASVALGAFIALSGGRLAPRAGELRHWIALGAIQGFIPNVLTALGLRSVTAGTASMIQASAPLIVALIAHFAFHEERLAPRRIAGLAIGFCGVAWLAIPALIGDGTGDAAGIAFMMGVTLSYALAALYIRGVGGGDPLRLAFGQQTFSALPSIVLTLAFESSPATAMDPLQLAAWRLGIGLVATAAPMLLYMRLLTVVGPTRSALVYYLLPLWATILGVALLGERVAMSQIGAGALVLAGVWLASRRSLSAN